MSSIPLRILSRVALPGDAADLIDSAFGPFTLDTCADDAALAERLHRDAGDLLLLPAEPGDMVREWVGQVAAEVAIVIVAPSATAADAGVVIDWLQRGAQDVLSDGELSAAALAPRLRAAVERKRLEREARKAYATDLDTGLPHQQQLIEHMSQLLALREREPAPMAVLVLRIEGLATTEARLGREAAQALRRKLGVRLRAGVRTSDVVASIGEDSFAVLLGALLTPADAQRVGDKLLAALQGTFIVAGQELAVASALGIGLYPEDGAQPEALLRKAVSVAAAAPARGRAGHVNFQEAGGQMPGAANDE